MKCTRCRRPAEVKIRAHNSAFCRECYLLFFRRRVVRTIEKEKMFDHEARILVAVSGGKDSLALWDVLASEGFQTVGFHLALGIGAYSRRSLDKTRSFAESRHLDLRVHDLSREGLAVPDMMQATRRSPCAACGTAKRHFFDAAALESSCNVIATGHNLDDEAARLLGNVLRWQIDHLARQRPVLETSHEKFVRKVKPLYLTSELETASFAFLRGLEYVVEECPNAAGATQLTYKALLDRLEATSPGSKLGFVHEFVTRGSAGFVAQQRASAPRTCGGCGMPAFAELCSFCSLRAEITRKQSDPKPDAPPR